MNNRATTKQISLYKHALLLHKLYSCNATNYSWLSLFFKQHFNAKQKYTLFVLKIQSRQLAFTRQIHYT